MEIDRYWLDTEFIEDGKTIELISIALVCDDGREYYAISNEFDESRANEWVALHVLTNLEPKNQGGSTFWKPRHQIRDDIVRFVFGSAEGQSKFMSGESTLEFWADYCSYDWVALCQLFGTMMELPTGFPMYCNDIQQWRRSLGSPDLPRQTGVMHHALSDARWDKQAWEFLRSLQ